jgi:uncharacterized protein (TIGR03382 family)
MPSRLFLVLAAVFLAVPTLASTGSLELVDFVPGSEGSDGTRNVSGIKLIEYDQTLVAVNWAPSGDYMTYATYSAGLLPNREFNFGDHHGGLAVSPDERYFYMTNYYGGSVTRIDTASDYAATTLGVGSWAQHPAISPDGNRLLVSSGLANGSSSGPITVIDTSGGGFSTLGSVALSEHPGRSTQAPVAFSDDSGTAWLTVGKGATAAAKVIELSIDETVSRTRSVDIPATSRLGGIARAGTTLYAADVDQKKIWKIDVGTFAITGSIDLDYNVGTLVLHPDGKHLITLESWPDPGTVQGHVGVLDLVTEQPVAGYDLQVDDTTHFSELVITSRGDRFYVGKDDGNVRGSGGIFTLDFGIPERAWNSGVTGQWDIGDNWEGGQVPQTRESIAIAPDSGLIVQGPSSPVDLFQVRIGSTGTGIAELRTQPLGQITARGAMIIEQHGKLRLDGAMNAELGVDNSGQIEIIDGAQLNGGTLTNWGVISGHGSIANRLVNDDGGEVRASAGQSVRFVGPNNWSFGTITNTGGQIEFTQVLNNCGAISGRGSFAFNGSLYSVGSLQFSGGFTDVSGPVTIGNGGRAIISGGSTTTFYGDVEVTSGGELRVSDFSNAVFFGDVALRSGSFQNGSGNVFFEGQLSIGDSPGLQEFNSAITLNGPSGGLLVEIAGTDPNVPEFDRYIFNRGITLNNAFLTVVFTGLESGDPVTYFPRFGDTFDFMDWGATSGTLSGQFNPSLINLPVLPANLTWNLSSLYTTGTITITPEPATACLVALGGSLLLRRRRYQN